MRLVKEKVRAKTGSFRSIILKDYINNEAMRHHMKDILEYRTMEYYRRRYETDSKRK